MKDSGGLILVWNVPTGSIVVVISAGYGGPLPPQMQPTPSVDAISIGSGVVATDTESATSSLWSLYMPDGLRVGVDARFAAPGIDAMRAQVHALVVSIRPIPAS